MEVRALSDRGEWARLPVPAKPWDYASSCGWRCKRSKLCTSATCPGQGKRHVGHRHNAFPCPRQPLGGPPFSATAIVSWQSSSLIDGEKTVGELASLMGPSRSASSHHLALLTEVGVVESRADGVRRFYSCKSEAAKAVVVLFDDLAKDEKLPTGFDRRRR
ncbi:ArsR family transcriptional regulator [Mesorhizobium sp. 113-3-3]|uniref:ArsR family transcriptional regulator n=1 Tax=Mesorhizobium sp. 113-3-3 TaxID=2744516 RepID=UPI0018EDD531